MLYEITLLIYNLSLIPVIFFSVLFIILALVNLGMDDRPRSWKKMKELPFVSIQVPTFNDPIAERCVRKCLNMDYPKDKFEIIIADDSTNIQTQEILRRYSEEFPGKVKYIHRDNREGFKPGALKNAMKITDGEIIVVFDADWIPRKDFLRKIVRPFSDPGVAIVQSRQGFSNAHSNIITRFAAYILTVYHVIVMPINNKVNSVFFCGTAGAIRREAFDEVGGWNMKSITEDADLSLKLLLKGYRTEYLSFETPSEVPDTFEGFIKQQMRWCYGNARVFFDNASKILFDPNLTLGQRMMILYITLGNLVAPFVVIMTIFGLSGWFLGEPALFDLWDFVDLVSRFLFTAGFILLGVVTLVKLGRMNEFKDFLVSALAMGIVLAFANSIAFTRAVFNKGLHSNWYCTPKVDNQKALK